MGAEKAGNSFIPPTPTDITPDWLSQVLGFEVQASRVADAHEGTTGRAVIELQGDHDAGLPRRIFAKLKPSSTGQQAFVESSDMGRREARFYYHLAAEAPIRTPRCYHADWNDNGSEYIMLLEQLEDSGCTFRPARQYSMPWIKAVISAFAALHATYWESPRFASDLSWMEPAPFSPAGTSLTETALQTYGGTLPPIFTELGEMYLGNAERIHELWQSGPCTVHHGDPHDGNQFLDGERPGFLDWGVVARGPGMRDVGYFIAGILRPEDRHLAPELVNTYRSELVGRGVSDPPGEDELWQQFLWHAMYVWLGCATTLGAGEEFQPSKYVLAAVNKLHPTLAEFGVADAVRAAI